VDSFQDPEIGICNLTSKFCASQLEGYLKKDRPMLPLFACSRRIAFRLLVLLPGCLAADSKEPPVPPGRVGPLADGGAVLPVGQYLIPAGRQVDLPGIRPLVLALSPDGRLLVTSGLSQELLVLDPNTGEEKQRVMMAPRPENRPPSASNNILDQDPSSRPQASYTGLVFSPDGRRIYLSDVQGSIRVFEVDGQGQVRTSSTG